MTKIGFNVLAWSAVVSDDLMPLADRLKKIGYDGVECFVGAAEDPAAYQRFGKHVQGLGMEMTGVTVVSPDTNPISESALCGRKRLDRIKWTIDRTHDLGAHILCGPFTRPMRIFPSVRRRMRSTAGRRKYCMPPAYTPHRPGDPGTGSPQPL